MKIYSTLPDSTKKALLENLKGIEFVNKEADADVTLPAFSTPSRLGDIIDIIENLSNQTIKCGRLNINLSTRKISNGKAEVDITEKEADIISYLSKSKKPCSREEMLKNIWGYADDASTKTVETHIYRLRNKVSEAFDDEIIITENGNYHLQV